MLGKDGLLRCHAERMATCIRLRLWIGETCFISCVEGQYWLESVELAVS